MRLATGRLSFAAQEGVDLLSAREVSVTAGGLRVTATEGHVVLQSLSFLGDAVRAEIDRVKLLAQSFDAVLERFSQRVQRSYRTVDGDRPGPRAAHRLHGREDHEPSRRARADHAPTSWSRSTPSRSTWAEEETTMFANTQMSGIDFAFPDVCNTPPVPEPIPYPNIGPGPMGVPACLQHPFHVRAGAQPVDGDPPHPGRRPGHRAGRRLGHA